MTDERRRSSERAFLTRPDAETATAALADARRAGEAAPPELLAWALDVTRWDDLPAGLQEAVGVALARDGLTFEGLERCELGRFDHQVAFLRYMDGARFAVVPGGEVTLGFDRERFVPSPDQLAEFAASTQTAFDVTWEAWIGGMYDAAEGYSSDALTPMRSVVVEPLLAEVEARPFRGEAAERRRRLAAAGFELPTSDAWEHLCQGGARTVFRWGDDCPTEQLPTTPELVWDLHRRPNAFGLRFSPDPYRRELVAEPGLLRGGDGGGMICGGAGIFVSWLCLASCFLSREAEDRSCRYGYYLHRRVRRLLPAQGTTRAGIARTASNGVTS